MSGTHPPEKTTTPTVLHQPPSLQRYAALNTNRYRYFRWTTRTARLTFVYVVVVPTLLGVLAYKTEGKWQFRGKRRGDVIAEF